MTEPAGRLPGFDAATPNVARIYDFMLGGKDAAVRYVASQGVSQFLDVGAGLPRKTTSTRWPA